MPEQVDLVVLDPLDGAGVQMSAEEAGAEAKKRESRIAGPQREILSLMELYRREKIAVETPQQFLFSSSFHYHPDVSAGCGNLTKVFLYTVPSERLLEGQAAGERGGSS